MELKPMNFIVPHFKWSRTKEKLFPFLVALDMSRTWIWCLNVNNVVSGNSCSHKKSFHKKREELEKKRRSFGWLHIYLWCSFAGVTASMQVSRSICERYFLWRPNWAPVLYSKVPTHMCILCLFYARRQCCSWALSAVLWVLAQAQYTTIRAATFTFCITWVLLSSLKQTQKVDFRNNILRWTHVLYEFS